MNSKEKIDWYTEQKIIRKTFRHWRENVKVKGLVLVASVSVKEVLAPFEAGYGLGGGNPYDLNNAFNLIFSHGKNTYPFLIPKKLTSRSLNLSALVKKLTTKVPIGKCVSCKEKTVLFSDNKILFYSVSYEHRDVLKSLKKQQRVSMCHSCVHSYVIKGFRRSQIAEDREVKVNLKSKLGLLLQSKKEKSNPRIEVYQYSEISMAYAPWRTDIVNGSKRIKVHQAIYEHLFLEKNFVLLKGPGFFLTYSSKGNSLKILESKDFQKVSLKKMKSWSKSKKKSFLNKFSKKIPSSFWKFCKKDFGGAPTGVSITWNDNTTDRFGQTLEYDLEGR